ADVGPGRALFEANETWHHHFVCRRCRRIFDVRCVKGRKPCLRLSARVGEADEAQIIFRGLCSGCGGQKKVRGG
ncbi:MAG TPA: transcriptional repressor, partial [Planctomycetota bacterium]|nr:transcriptional repressor [Planctomycetota bacterium]